MNEEYLEHECDEPADWQTNVIFRRDAMGMVRMIEIPDDTGEVDEDAGNT